MSGLKDEVFLSGLSESGSLTPDMERQGVVSAKLIRPVYNLEELRRSIDTRFTELIKDDAEATVSQSTYDEALSKIDELTAEIETLNGRISDKQTDIAALRREKGALEQEITTKNSRIRTLEMQLEASNNQITELIRQFQSAIAGMGGDAGSITPPKPPRPLAGGGGTSPDRENGIELDKDDEMHSPEEQEVVQEIANLD